jgi:RNA polymerase sigma factor (TIGR02999 family)
VWVPDAGTRDLVFDDAGCLILEPIGGPRTPGLMVFSKEFPDMTSLLTAIEQGDPHAAEQLLPLVYDELRKLAAQRLAHEKPGQTLQATALVHEAYLRLVGGPGTPTWENARHFFAAAAEAMRRILIERARRKRACRHGGGHLQCDLSQIDLADRSLERDLLDLDEALLRLGTTEPDAAGVVKLRVFAGLSVEQAGSALGLSRAQAYRHWTYARAWLHAHLRDESRAAR